MSRNVGRLLIFIGIEVPFSARHALLLQWSNLIFCFRKKLFPNSQQLTQQTNFYSKITSSLPNAAFCRTDSNLHAPSNWTFLFRLNGVTFRMAVRQFITEMNLLALQYFSLQTRFVALYLRNKESYSYSIKPFKKIKTFFFSWNVNRCFVLFNVQKTNVTCTVND